MRVNREHNKADAVGKVIRFDTRNPRGLVAEIRIAATQRGDDTLALAAEQALSASIGFGVPPAGSTSTAAVAPAVSPGHGSTTWRLSRPGL